LLNQVAGGNGVFLMGAHLGSFEVIRALGWKDTDLRIAMVMHEVNAQKINATLAAVNPEATQDIIGLGRVDSMLKVRERLIEGWVVGMLADRTPGDDNPVPGATPRRKCEPAHRTIPDGGIPAAPGGVHDRSVPGRQPLRNPLRSPG
jgi:predicted LPLAT superfamily acyltransferase